MIEAQREDPKEALYLFYELLDEYRNIEHRHVAEVNNVDEEKINRSWSGYCRLEKIRGTFKPKFKPAPKRIIIREVRNRTIWFQMVAKNDKDEILFIWSSEEMEKVFQRATEVFGIEKKEWKFEKSS